MNMMVCMGWYGYVNGTVTEEETGMSSVLLFFAVIFCCFGMSCNHGGIVGFVIIVAYLRCYLQSVCSMD